MPLWSSDSWNDKNVVLPFLVTSVASVYKSAYKNNIFCLDIEPWQGMPVYLTADLF